MLTIFQTSFLAASSGDVLGWDFPLHPSNKAMATRVTRKKKFDIEFFKRKSSHVAKFVTKEKNNKSNAAAAASCWVNL